MSLATSNRDGGRTSEAGHLRALLKGLKGQILTGLSVSQRGAGANMSVDVAIGDAMIPRSDGTYGHPSWNDAVYNQVIATADVSNPRRDIIVMYIDYATTPSTGVSNNTNGVVKIKSVAGTPAGSPADPSAAAIQSSVGSGNPYVILARVRVGAGASSITNSVIDDLRLMAQGLLAGGWTYDDLYTWVYASSTTFTIAGVDARSQFPLGTKLALYQSGAIKYFYVTATAFSTNTTVTVSGEGTYTLANVPIDKPAFSYALNPVDFPFAAVSPGHARTLLGVNFATSTQTGITTVETDLAFALVTVLVPKNNTNLILKITVPNGNSTGGTADQQRFYFKEGSTYYGTATFSPANSFGQEQNYEHILPNVSAGLHTYKVAVKRTNGTGSYATNYATGSPDFAIPSFAVYAV